MDNVGTNRGHYALLQTGAALIEAKVGNEVRIFVSRTGSVIVVRHVNPVTNDVIYLD